MTVILLGLASPPGSSNLPGDDAGNVIVPLFGLAPGGVYRAMRRCPRTRCALTAPFHPYLIPLRGHRRSALCCTGRQLTLPRGYLAPCPMEPGLSSAPHCTEMHRDDATVWPTPPWALSHVRRHCAARNRMSGKANGRNATLTGPRVQSPRSRAPPAASPPGTPHRRRSGAHGSSRIRRRPPRRWCWRGCRSRGRG